MPLARRSPQLETWSAPQCPFLIEYDLRTFEEIGREVHAGMRAEGEDGVEVGGLLFGTFDGERLRILRFEPMECEHADGPGFTLSENDKLALEERLAANARLSHSDGYAIVGWYHSHLHGGPAFSDADIAIHDQYFPEPWQVLLLQRPDSHGNIRAGFFFREAKSDGASPEILPEREPAPPFSEPVSAASERVAVRPPAPRPRRTAPELPARRPPALEPALLESSSATSDPLPVPVPHAAPFIPAPLPEPDTRSGQNRMVWAGMIAMLALCAGTVFYLRSNFLAGERHAGPGIVHVEAAKRDGFVEVSWDKDAIGSAQKGRIEVHDGAIRGQIPLDRNALMAGRMPYRPSSDVASFRLVIERPDGPLEGSTTFVVPGGPGTAVAAITAPAPNPTVPPPVTIPAGAAPLVAQNPAAAPAQPLVNTAPPPKDDRKPAAVLQPPVEKSAPQQQPSTSDAAARQKTVEIPKLEPLPSPEPIQTAQVQRPLLPDRTITLPPPPQPAAAAPSTAASASTAPAPTTAAAPTVTRPAPAAVTPAPALHLSGRWLLKPGGYSRSPAVPESLSITVTDSNGGIRGTLEARYRSRAKTDHIHFSFSGKVNGASARFPWTASDGQHGEIEFIRVPNSADVMEVVWHGPESKQVFDELLKRVN